MLTTASSESNQIKTTMVRFHRSASVVGTEPLLTPAEGTSLTAKENALAALDRDYRHEGLLGEAEMHGYQLEISQDRAQPHTRESLRIQKRLQKVIDILDDLPQTGSIDDESETASPELDDDGNYNNHLFSLRQDWSGRGSHAEFAPTELLPFQKGRSLGHGLNGEVIEVTCKGIGVALKKVYQRQKLQENQMEETKILKSLRHHHIVSLVGTYYQIPYVGLLIWPVASCDLAWLIMILRDPEIRLFLTERESNKVVDPLQQHLDERGVVLQDFAAICDRSTHVPGRLASAVAYLHSKKIRHKDIKPSNILLSPEGVWLTDFGSAKDFTDNLTSTSESRERGTLRYCAPEVSRYEESGRSADIFSMGCVFLEVLVVVSEWGFDRLDKLRPAGNGSYEANLDRTDEWISLVEVGGTEADVRTQSQDILRLMLKGILHPERTKRPKTKTVLLRLMSIQVDNDCDFLCQICSQ